MEMMTSRDELQRKLHILADAAKYDVACTSSGVDRQGREGLLGNARACGICHSFAGDGRCISLLKILMTNHCVYDCKYCLNRSSNDVPRAAFTPEEICELTIEFYKRNYIEGLFLSSGVLRSPSYTMEQICKALSLLRTHYKFNGYIHVKAIPGAPDHLLALAGHLADRISINMELPTAESLERLAPNKTFETILGPMAKVSDTIAAHRLAVGRDARMERSRGNRYLPGSIFGGRQPEGVGEPDRRTLAAETAEPGKRAISTAAGKQDKSAPPAGAAKPVRRARAPWDAPSVSDAYKRDLSLALAGKDRTRPFAPAGQSTQMIIGADGESDYNLIRTSQKLYQSYDLKRVFYSAYIPINEDAQLPAIGTAPPLLREHRLYQADWLLRFYGFQADELLSEERPNFNEQLDPKCDWALRHLGLFPLEMQTAPYDMILRVPGVGPRSAARIVKARRYGSLDFDILKKMGVVLKRAHYFITCGGKMMYHIPLEEQYITRQLVSCNQKENWQTAHQNESSGRQLSLFDDFGLH